MLIVADTNVFVSALFSQDGNEAEVIRLVASRRVTLPVSPDILVEYENVMLRRKFAFAGARRQTILQVAREFGVMVEPEIRLSVSADEADNRFIECAEAAGADLLITDNLKHFPARHGPTRMMNATEFLRLHNANRT